MAPIQRGDRLSPFRVEPAADPDILDSVIKSKLEEEEKPKKPKAEEKEDREAAPRQAEHKAEAEKPAPTVEKSEEARVKASPVARRIAAEFGVDLASVKGTGPEGRVTETDVRAAAKSKPAAPTPSLSEGEREVSSAPRRDRRGPRPLLHRRMVAPRVRSGLDRQEAILTVRCGSALPDAQEVRIVTL